MSSTRHPLRTLPMRSGVAASRLQLAAGPWTTVLDGLVARFPSVGRAQWLDRMARGLVLDGQGVPIDARTPYRTGAQIHYWREVPNEPRFDAEETVVYQDEHMVVADKPHGISVMPAGGAVTDTLLARLVRRLGNAHLAPLHRIDRATAGLVMFSAHPASRERYHALFRNHRIDKRYEALAPPLPAVEFPLVRRTRIVRGEPFFRMCEVEGTANSETRITVVARGQDAWHYALEPVTGRKHQLRIHMAGLGAPIRGDGLYPELCVASAAPLQLLAQSLAFEDPVERVARSFRSGFTLVDRTPPATMPAGTELIRHVSTRELA